MGHARGDSQMLVHIVGRTLKGQAIDEYQYVNSEGDGIELKPGDYELTVDEPPSPPTARVTVPQSAWFR